MQGVARVGRVVSAYKRPPTTASSREGGRKGGRHTKRENDRKRQKKERERKEKDDTIHLLKAPGQLLKVTVLGYRSSDENIRTHYENN